MARDKMLSHARIVSAAWDEFTENGYEKASMRRIGERCGLTAAALYRHFDSKEAMFDALVRPALNDMQAWVEEHYERSAIEQNGPGTGSVDMTADNEASDQSSDTASLTADGKLFNRLEIEMMRELIYPRMDEYDLLINKAAGSAYENFVHDMVSRHQSLMEDAIEKLREEGNAVRDISHEELHMLVTAYISALFEPVVHHYPLETALRYLDTVEAFFSPGWRIVIG